jgi:hypothetical protein
METITQEMIDNQLDLVADMYSDGWEMDTHATTDEDRTELEAFSAKFYAEEAKLFEMEEQLRKQTIKEKSMDTIAKLEAHIAESQAESVRLALQKSQPALISQVASVLFKKGATPLEAMVMAVSFIESSQYFGDEDYEIVLTSLVEQATVSVEEEVLSAKILDPMAILLKAELLGEGNTAGPLFVKICGQQKEAYAPMLHGEEWERRFDYAPVKTSPLFVEAIHALEDTQYTVDANMLAIAIKVDEQLNRSHKLNQMGYVLEGCMKMDPELAYFSEFKGDRRLRINHAACHGPNGQADDRSRALMDLYGVSTDYDVKKTIKLLTDEMKDMGKFIDKSDFMACVYAYADTPVECILLNLRGEMGTNIKKPWSFAKAAMTLMALKEYTEFGGVEKPYIGMAFGLDAKCSGPQLGALLVDDHVLAAACGFSKHMLDDAYHMAIQYCERAGFVGLTRELIKKPYMGIFYGQGFHAFMECEDEELQACIGYTEDNAKAFHKAVSQSFGPKMLRLRQTIKNMVVTDRVSHSMPDGAEVKMDYRVKVDIHGSPIDMENEGKDIVVRGNVLDQKFQKLTMKTSAANLDDFTRTGFVNMIQATDALLARLIIVNAKRLGAQHIVSIHDCFRVNVHDMDILEAAIKRAYKALFGYRTNCKTADLPLGTDILDLYFQGAKKAGAVGNYPKQFTNKGFRTAKVNGVAINDLVDALGETYFFAK